VANAAGQQRLNIARLPPLIDPFDGRLVRDPKAFAAEDRVSQPYLAKQDAPVYQSKVILLSGLVPFSSSDLGSDIVIRGIILTSAKE
jgi:hypothetical protein